MRLDLTGCERSAFDQNLSGLGYQGVNLQIADLDWGFDE
jgi:hypothetical protein